MNTILKQRWLAAILILLLAANIATLVYMWLPKKERPAPPPSSPEKLIEKLQFSKAQQDSFLVLRNQHQEAVKLLRPQLKEAKDSFFALLDKDTVSEAAILAAAARSAAIQQQLDLAAFRHFKQVRLLCNKEQQKTFDAVIQDVIRQMGPAAPQRRPNGPPPGEHEGPGGPYREHDGPPPPDHDGPPPPPHDGPPGKH